MTKKIKRLEQSVFSWSRHKPVNRGYGHLVCMFVVALGMMLGVASFVNSAYAQDASERDASNTVEIEFWQSIKDSTDAAEYEAYLAAFPDGHFAALARVRIRQLSAATPAVSPDGESVEVSEDQPEAGEPAAPELQSEIASQNGNTSLLPADLNVAIPVPEQDRQWIGVNINNLSPRLAREHGLEFLHGVFVSGIMEFGPAANSDLQSGDIILAINGARLRDGTALIAAVKASAAGEVITLSGLRAGGRFSTDVTIGNMVAVVVEAAKSGNPGAAIRVSNLLRSAMLGQKDEEMADRVLRLVAATGNAQANTLLAQHLMAVPADQRDNDAILASLSKAIEENDLVWSPVAMNLMGNFLVVQESPEKKAEAYGWFRRAAKHDNSNAVYQLAWAYLKGDGGLQQDLDAGMKLMHQAGDEIDHTAALLNIAVIYTNGSQGREINRETAIAAARRVADHAEQGRVPEDWNENLASIFTAWETTPYDPREIQQLLTDLGHNLGAVDGKIGKGSRRAIKKFQSEQGLEETGEPSVALVMELRWAMDRKR